jgi:hypothetical protein
LVLNGLPHPVPFEAEAVMGEEPAGSGWRRGLSGFLGRGAEFL